jgi:hypothetical protein
MFIHISFSLEYVMWLNLHVHYLFIQYIVICKGLGFGLTVGSIVHLHLLTANKAYAVTLIHTLQFTRALIYVLSACSVFTHFFGNGFPNCTHASHTATFD